MILWVAKVCSSVLGKKNVYVATENEKIFKLAIENGYKAVMTSKNCLTGTDRLAEVAKKIRADIYVNVQGDEPLVNSKDIKRIIKEKQKFPNEVINGYTKITKKEDPKNINIPKVIFTKNNRLIYISRQIIPGFKNKKHKPMVYYKQVCIYAFSRSELLTFKDYKGKSIIEKSEDIEILRFLEWNKTIRVVKTSVGSLAVDSPEDIKPVEIELKKNL